MIDAAILREFLNYDPETGVFTWARDCGRRKAGAVTGCHDKANNYVRISFIGKLYWAHRLAFLHMTGRWPEEVDHIDRNGTNNAWGNLREADRSGNQANRRSSSSLGRGVVRKGRRFRASMTYRGKRVYLGTYDTPEDAARAYAEAARASHGEFASV